MTIERYGSFKRLLRVTVIVLRFIKLLKSKISRGPHENRNEDVKDLNMAEVLWIRATQISCFPEEIKLLSDGKGDTTGSRDSASKIIQFGLCLDEAGVLRSRGRLNESSLPLDSKNPIFLPNNHSFINLLILHTHNEIKHSGVRDTLTTIRERFWILRGREVVKKLIRHCVVCRKYGGKPLKPQPTPDLPDFQVSSDPPFTHIGLDFAGPFFIKSMFETKPTENGESNPNVKAYVLLITCASTRSVHIELTLGLSVQAFLLAFRRYASRRGLPATITSDNAKTFKSAKGDIERIIRSEEVRQYLVERRVKWNFIIERAPWWGGFWERLVASVKRPLKRIFGRSTLTYYELQTILVEIEALINARPLTYVYDDQECNYEPLTPSHLIYVGVLRVPQTVPIMKWLVLIDP